MKISEIRTMDMNLSQLDESVSNQLTDIIFEKIHTHKLVYAHKIIDIVFDWIEDHKEDIELE